MMICFVVVGGIESGREELQAEVVQSVRPEDKPEAIQRGGGGKAVGRPRLVREQVGIDREDVPRTNGQRGQESLARHHGKTMPRSAFTPREVFATPIDHIFFIFILIIES